MAQMWADAEKRRRFDLVILAIVAVVIAITLVVIFVMATIGIPVMSFMYGVDFEQFRGLSYIMIAAGGVTAIIAFIYQVITVLRRQKAVMKLYVITFGFSLFIPILLIDFTGLPGAVIGYLIVMTILLVLLVWEYASIRWELYRHPERVEETLAGEEAAARAYEESTAGTRARRVSEVRNRRGESWDSHEARNRGVNQVRSTEASFSGGVMKGTPKICAFRTSVGLAKHEFVHGKNARRVKLGKKRVFAECGGPTTGCATTVEILTTYLPFLRIRMGIPK